MRLLPLLPAVCLLASVQAQVGTVAGLLRGPDGRPVADAEGRFLPDVAHDLPALAGWRAGAAPITGAADAAGDLRMPVSASSGTLLVRSGAGLGAFLAWVAPDSPFRATLQPMAELTVAGDAAQALELHAASHHPILGRRLLPPLQESALRLPPGAYEAWLRVGGRWNWLRVELRPGERHVAAAPGDGARILQLPAGAARVFPRNWPTVTLLDATRPECLLSADAPPQLAMETTDGRLLDFGPVPARGPEAVLRGEPGTQLWLVVDAPAPGEPVWRGSVAPDGTVSAPMPESGVATLLALAPGRVPVALSWQQALDRPLAAAAPRQVTVLCSGPDGLPAAHAALELVPDGTPAATQRLRADARGVCRVEIDPTSTWRLLAVDPRFANDVRPVPADATAVELDLRAGAELVGRVLLPGDVPAAGVAVTLRDPEGRLRPPQRSVVADAAGRFRFAGLDPAASYVLFAQQVRGGHTWSARFSRTSPDGREWLLELRSEDPAPPGSDRW